MQQVTVVINRAPVMCVTSQACSSFASVEAD